MGCQELAVNVPVTIVVLLPSEMVVEPLCAVPPAPVSHMALSKRAMMFSLNGCIQ
jgi:hypothetical protein